MNYLYQTWLPASDYYPVDAPSFERYGEAFSPDNPVVEIYVPITKKQ
jgi:AraC family transcriptional regulator